MNSNFEPSGPGGFIPSALPSPPSTVASSTNVSLPHPRSQPLKRGGPKESQFVNYVDQRLLEISGRYERRFGDQMTKERSENESNGYESFGDVARDLEHVVDIIWVSGTPSLQISFLLNVALAVSIYLPSFPLASRPTFQLLHKLDVAFSSLLHGENVESGERLPGFDGGSGKVTITEKVRIRGLVERTRLAVINLAAQGGSIDESSVATDAEDYTTTDDDMIMSEATEDIYHGSLEMDIARVYERTLVDLGAALNVVENDGFI